VSELAPESETVIAFVADAFVTVAVRLDVPAIETVKRCSGTTVVESVEVPARVTENRWSGVTVAARDDVPASETVMRWYGVTVAVRLDVPASVGATAFVDDDDASQSERSESSTDYPCGDTARTRPTRTSRATYP